MTIKELDEYCRLRNKSIIVHMGKLAGFSTAYYVGVLDE